MSTITLITGANKGLGRETARRLVEAGHTVVVTARDADRGGRAAAALGAAFLPLDVTDDASVADAAWARGLGRAARPAPIVMPNRHNPSRHRPPSRTTARRPTKDPG